MSESSIYKVTFYNTQQEIFEIYARHIYQSEMWGFIEIEEIIFRDCNQLIVDPSEEKLKTIFDGVKRSYIPVSTIIRIDEVEREGTSKVSNIPNTLTNNSVTNIRTFPSKPSNKNT